MHDAHPDGHRNPAHGALAEVGASALRLGLTSFGGPVAHLGYFRREYVERRRWLDDDAFAQLVGLCQALPGPASSQLGIAIGARRAGPLGGLVAWLGFTAPSAVLMVAFAGLAGSGGGVPTGLTHGLALAAVAIVAQALVLMARRLTPDLPRAAMALAAGIAALLVASPLSQVVLIVAGAVVGWLLRPRAEAHRAVTGAPRRLPPVTVAVLAAFAGLLVALPLAAAATGWHVVSLADAFYRSGALVFGGGHVVLPLLQSAVVQPGWVDQDHFLAGYGAAQALPGPLFSFAAFLGAVEVPSPAGPLGGLIALVAIYLPSFLLLAAVLPVWDRVRDRFAPGLAGVGAVVVGLLAAALVNPLWVSSVHTGVDLAVLAAAAALLIVRAPPLVVVVLAAATGLALSA
ncbi:MAG TPA: chromate efflux transporter [Candidatus Sulfotelmatobacter sp.]|nr:chromate efflux transporter [Candidatus Sulfotelmatobacter sp.]